MDVLVHTIPPYDGGVPAKAAILCRHLEGLGHRVTVAHYATLGHDPDLVAPAWRPWTRPGLRRGTALGCPSVAVGCRWPELEWTYYQPSPAWTTLMTGFQRHVAVCGNVLAAWRLAAAGLPHLVWCASPVVDDRAARQAAMPSPRRWFDRMVTVPMLTRLERRVLAGPGRFLGVSRYTVEALAALGARRDRLAVLPVPVDCDRYRPPARPAPAGVVGFAGRLSDPRKNVGLLLKAVARANAGGASLSLRLTGDPLPAVVSEAARLGLGGRVSFTGHLPAEALPDYYAGLDLFAIPSHQEGLGIVGVEALATGLPVVSTRCGGPEDYVRDGETGWLVDDAEDMARRLSQLAADRADRQRLSQGARRLAETVYGLDAWARGLADGWRTVWGDEP